MNWYICPGGKIAVPLVGSKTTFGDDSTVFQSTVAKLNVPLNLCIVKLIFCILVDLFWPEIQQQQQQTQMHVIGLLGLTIATST